MEKRNVLRFDLKESREGFCRRGSGKPFHVEGPKTEKAREPTAESLARTIWRLRVSEAEKNSSGGKPFVGEETVQTESKGDAA